MSLNYPTIDDLAAQIRAEFRRQLPEVDPTVSGSWARGFADGNAVLAQSISFLVRDLEKELFPQTASGEFLDLWGEYEGLERNLESPSSGNFTVEGTAGEVIPVLTDFTGSNGIDYQSTAVSAVTSVNQSISTLTRSGSTVTAELPSEHQLATGITVTISGATEPEYNGDFLIVVTSPTSFQYTITGAPVSPATGAPEYDVDIAVVTIEAQENGTVTNLDSGATISFVTPLANVESSGFVQFNGIAGGTSEETDDEYRVRILLSRSIIEGVFTPDQVKLAALSVPGNTRAFVKKPTLSVCSSSSGSAVTPVPGQISVFILRDNDSDITPSQLVLDTTKQAIVEDGSLPSHTSEVDLFVEAPTLVETDFDFTALNPDTTTMRSAVQAQLQAFFEDTVDFEETVTEASYLGAIQSTQDLQTGAFIISFALSTPSGNIAVTDGEIATLGNVTFSI